MKLYVTFFLKRLAITEKHFEVAKCDFYPAIQNILAAKFVENKGKEIQIR